jgi:hypothetical protein
MELPVPSEVDNLHQHSQGIIKDGNHLNGPMSDKLASVYQFNKTLDEIVHMGQPDSLILQQQNTPSMNHHERGMHDEVDDLNTDSEEDEDEIETIKKRWENPRTEKENSTSLEKQNIRTQKSN